MFRILKAWANCSRMSQYVLLWGYTWWGSRLINISVGVLCCYSLEINTPNTYHTYSYKDHEYYFLLRILGHSKTISEERGKSVSNSTPPIAFSWQQSNTGTFSYTASIPLYTNIRNYEEVSLFSFEMHRLIFWHNVLEYLNTNSENLEYYAHKFW